MAETWGEYFGGTQRERMADKQRRDKSVEDLRNSPLWKLMPREPVYSPSRGTVVDPREIRMQALQEVDTPQVETEWDRDRQKAWDYTVAPAYKAVFETGMRPRDTLIKAAQAAGSGDGWKAAELAARAPLSTVYWPAAAGTPDSPDDWRKDASELGISDGNILALDLLTDPETYMALPIPLAAAGKASAAMRAGKAAGLARGLDAMRYGSGVPAHLVDQYGDVIRRLRNAPVAR